jgi:hypothetical protein
MAVRVVGDTALPSDNLGDGSLGGGFDFAKWLQQQLAAQAVIGGGGGGLGGTTVAHGPAGGPTDPMQPVRAPSGYGQNAPGNPGDETTPGTITPVAGPQPAPFTPTMPTMPPVPTGGQPAAPGPMDPTIIARQKAAAAGSTVAGDAPMSPRKPRPAGAGNPFTTVQYQVPGSGYRVAGANYGPLGGNSPIYTALDLSRLFGRT